MYRFCSQYQFNTKSRSKTAKRREDRIQFALTKDKWFYESCELGNIRFWFHFFVKFWKTFQIYGDLNPLTTNVTIIQKPVS